jgi:hypothetical protein
MESTYYSLLAPASYGGLSKFEPKGYTKKQGKKTILPDPLNPPATGGQFHRLQRVSWEIVV